MSKYRVICPDHGVIPSYMAVQNDPRKLALIHIKMNPNCATRGVEIFGPESAHPVYGKPNET